MRISDWSSDVCSSDLNLLPNYQAVLIPHLELNAIIAGSTKAFALVPVKLGKYELECTAPLHATFGMLAIQHEAHAFKNGSREPDQECYSKQDAIDAEGYEGEAGEKSDEPPHGQAGNNESGKKARTERHQAPMGEIGRATVRGGGRPAGVDVGGGRHFTK